LADKLDLAIVATGDLLKKAIAEESQWGLEAKALQDAGRVVTEDIILGLLREQLLHPAMTNGFILDGFPRNLLQALTLDELLLEIGKPLDRVLLIDIDSDHLMERLVGRRTCRSCGQLYNAYRNPPIVEGVCDVCGGRLHQRSDDNEETVSSRIHVFDHLIAPLITHYNKSDRLIRVDGNGTLEQVFENLLEAIEAARTSMNQVVATSPNVEKRADKASNPGKKGLTKKAKKIAEKKVAVNKSATGSGKQDKEPRGHRKSSSKKTASKVSPAKKRAAVVKKKKVSKKAASKPSSGQKKARQSKKKVSATSTAKIVKKAAVKKRKSLSSGKSGALAKSTKKAAAKKGKVSATPKKSAPAKKKVAKKRPQAAKAKLSKKVTKKKPLLKKAQKTTAKKRSATKKKLTSKQLSTSKAKKRVAEQNRSARKKALKKKTKM
jgi:adenylate kinase